MSIDAKKKRSISRRMFVGDAKCLGHVFSFTQKSDGSIYVSTPSFRDTQFLSVGIDGRASVVNSPGDGKLSLHGSGTSHVRTNDGSVKILKVEGAILADMRKGQLGLRHLFSASISEPKPSGVSPAHSRKSDYSIAAKKLEPHIFVFWAIPKGFIDRVRATVTLPGRKVEVNWGGFEMLFHGLMWLAYRTESMNNWPPSTLICTLDGAHVPMLFPQFGENLGMVVRLPKWQVDDTKLLVEL